MELAVHVCSITNKKRQWKKHYSSTKASPKLTQSNASQNHDIAMIVTLTKDARQARFLSLAFGGQMDISLPLTSLLVNWYIKAQINRWMRGIEALICRRLPVSHLRLASFKQIPSKLYLPIYNHLPLQYVVVAWVRKLKQFFSIRSSLYLCWYLCLYLYLWSSWLSRWLGNCGKLCRSSFG